jgi:hypothetical protein
MSSTIFTNPVYAPLEPAYIKVMSKYNKLRNTIKKLFNSIKYNDNNSSQGVLPLNLREIILTPHTWPSEIDKEICHKINSEEQVLWSETLTKIFLGRQNHLRTCFAATDKEMAKYVLPDSLQVIFLEEVPELRDHPDALAFLIKHFLENVTTTSMDETTSSSSSSSVPMNSNPLVMDLTDNSTTKELLLLVKTLTLEMTTLKNSFGAGKKATKNPSTTLPVREKLPKQPKKADTQNNVQFQYTPSVQPPFMPYQQPPPFQHPYGYQQMPINPYQQYHNTSYPGQHMPYPYMPMNGPYHQISNFSPPPPPLPLPSYAHTSGTVNPTATVNPGNTKSSTVRYSNN